MTNNNSTAKVNENTVSMLRGLLRLENTPNAAACMVRYHLDASNVDANVALIDRLPTNERNGVLFELDGMLKRGERWNETEIRHILARCAQLEAERRVVEIPRVNRSRR